MRLAKLAIEVCEVGTELVAQDDLTGPNIQRALGKPQLCISNVNGRGHAN
jgi:hypothetical protein